MLNDKSMSANDVKRILMLFEHFKRLEVLNQRLENWDVKNIKNHIASENEEQSGDLKKSMLLIVDEIEKTRNDFKLCYATMLNILLAFEKIIFSE